MKRLTFFLAALATLGGVVAFRAPASGQTDAEAAPSYGVKIPPGYRSFKVCGSPVCAAHLLWA